MKDGMTTITVVVLSFATVIMGWVFVFIATRTVV